MFGWLSWAAVSASRRKRDRISDRKASSGGRILTATWRFSRVSRALALENFHCEAVESLSYPDESFDSVLSIAVLHFARNSDHFHQMVHEMWRVLKPGGILFARLGSTIGIEDRVKPLDDAGRFAVPDGSTRYLVDMETLARLTVQLDASLVEPIKTVNVQHMRCMTNWVLSKN